MPNQSRVSLVYIHAYAYILMNTEFYKKLKLGKEKWNNLQVYSDRIRIEHQKGWGICISKLREKEIQEKELDTFKF